MLSSVLTLCSYTFVPYSGVAARGPLRQSPSSASQIPVMPLLEHPGRDGGQGGHVTRGPFVGLWYSLHRDCIAASFCITHHPKCHPVRRFAMQHCSQCLSVFVSVNFCQWLSGEVRIQRGLLQGGEKPDVRAPWQQTGSYHLGQRPYTVCSTVP